MKQDIYNQNGSITLGLVFGLGMLGLGIAATTLLFATTSITNSSIAGQGVRSLITSDSANREGVHRVLKTYDAIAETVSFSGAEIPQLNLTNNARVDVSGTWPAFRVRSSSGNPNITRNIVTTVDLFPSAFAFDQAVYTNGEIGMSGRVRIQGNVYATDGIYLGGNATIEGDAYTPGEIETSGSSDINGAPIDNHEEILPPTIDTTDYFVTANLNSTYYTAGPAAESAIGSKSISGTYFVNSALDLNGNTPTFNGVLIVAGDLTINGGIFTADPSNPLVIYVGGDLYLSGNAELSGIVYVAGESTLGNGTWKIDGSLISVSGTNQAAGSGNQEIEYNPVYGEAWNNIIGLDNESGTDPKLVDWHEE